jgi:plastocyanin
MLDRESYLGQEQQRLRLLSITSAFSPQSMAVSVGATVTWINHDNVPHVVTSANDQFNKSPVLKTDPAFSNTFVTAGNYSYFCSIRPQMTGKVTVR